MRKRFSKRRTYGKNKRRGKRRAKNIFIRASRGGIRL
jgi:hypothetical protein